VTLSVGIDRAFLSIPDGEVALLQPLDLLEVGLFDPGRHPRMYENLVSGKPRLERVARLVDRVVPSDPRVAFVVRGEPLPQPHGAILEVPVAPEVGDVRVAVGAPVAVVTSRSAAPITVKHREESEIASLQVQCADQGWCRCPTQHKG
jgi:hypothetical protein